MSAGFEDHSYNGNGDYNTSHRQSDNNDQGTKPSFEERDDVHMPHKKMRRQEAHTEMRCLVPYKAAGGIIGKGGCNIKDMRESFSAQIQIPDSYGPERVLQVRASPESCGKILLRVLPTISESSSGRFRPGESSNISYLALLVHQSQAGVVTGGKGYKINELREKTGASIKMYRECAPNSTDRICVVSGSPDIISQCVVLIMELLVTKPPKGPVQNFDPAFDSAGGMGGEGFGFRGGNFGGQMEQRFGGRSGGRFAGSDPGGPRGGMGSGGGFNVNRGNFRGCSMMGGGRGGMGGSSYRGGRDCGMDRGGGCMGGGRGGNMFRGMRSGGGSGGGRFGGSRDRDVGGGFRGRGSRGGGSGGSMRYRSGEGGYENY